MAFKLVGTGFLQKVYNFIYKWVLMTFREEEEEKKVGVKRDFFHLQRSKTTHL